jgi:hypothetical protein
MNNCSTELYQPVSLLSIANPILGVACCCTLILFNQDQDWHDEPIEATRTFALLRLVKLFGRVYPHLFGIPSVPLLLDCYG